MKDETPDPQSKLEPEQPNVTEPALPDPALLAQWRSDYSTEMQLLGKTLPQLSDTYAMTVYSRWPDGSEWVRVENVCLFFSGPVTEDHSICAAVALDLLSPTTVEDLRESFGECLTFCSDDPLAGPCWTLTDGSLTYRFRTDETGQTLVEEALGGNLVLSMDPILPEILNDTWIAPADTWVELWAVEASSGWAHLMPHAAVLGSSAIPEGATDPADPQFFDLFFCSRGLKDPNTGVQYFSYENREDAPWDGVVVPASLVFGSDPPQNADALMDKLNTPFWWGEFSQTGYWFYVDQYSIFLSSDAQGAVGEDSYFLIAWGDNAGP